MKQNFSEGEIASERERREKEKRVGDTYQSSFGFDEGSILTIHFVVKTARIAKVVTSTIPAP